MAVIAKTLAVARDNYLVGSSDRQLLQDHSIRLYNVYTICIKHVQCVYIMYNVYTICKMCIQYVQCVHYKYNVYTICTMCIQYVQCVYNMYLLNCVYIEALQGYSDIRIP